MMRMLFVGVMLILCTCGCGLNTAETNELLLEGAWKVKLVDSGNYAGVNVKDSNWVSVKKIGHIQDLDQQYYNGSAWYRYKLLIPRKFREQGGGKKLELYFGLLGGRDQFYFNGHLIGCNNTNADTSFINSAPQDDLARKYEIAIDDSLINWDKDNIIALHIIEKKPDAYNSFIPYIHFSKLDLTTTYKFASEWSFQKGDSTVFSNVDFDDTGWAKIKPGKYWEDQGYAGVDGYAWYRTQFSIPNKAPGKIPSKSTLRLTLGKIDDADQVYLNGHLVGENGQKVKAGYVITDEFKRQPTLAGVTRFYDLTFDNASVNWQGNNVLAVRVFDSGGGGGIIGEPWFALLDQNNDIRVDVSKLYKINDKNRMDTIVVIHNNNRYTSFKGFVKYKVITQDEKVLAKRETNVNVLPGSYVTVPISIKATTQISYLNIGVDNQNQSNVFFDQIRIPFILVK